MPKEAEDLRDPREVRKVKHPGRSVPERIADRPYVPFHEHMNALWDLEYKGLPYAEKFGRERRLPAAPMPRLRTLTTPNISP